MLGFGGTTYSDYKETDHRQIKGFGFKTGDIITVDFRFNQNRVFFLRGEGDDQKKCSLQYNPEIKA